MRELAAADPALAWEPSYALPGDFPDLPRRFVIRSRLQHGRERVLERKLQIVGPRCEHSPVTRWGMVELCVLDSSEKFLDLPPVEDLALRDDSPTGRGY